MSVQNIFESLDFFLVPTRLCQAFFLLAASAVLAVAATPPTARGFLTQYGARSFSPSGKEGVRGHGAEDNFTKFIAWITSVGKVPHSWFKHFYVLSIMCSVFWSAQYFCNGAVLEAIIEFQSAHSSSPSMTIYQVQLAWLLMTLQGIRRLSECLLVMRTSSSKMWIFHWLLGCAYYLCTSVAVWIEGSDAILKSDRTIHQRWPSRKELIGLLCFLLAWSMQHMCHKHLSALKKYSLPTAGMFRYLICPHYTCECLLYLSLAVVAAPEQQLFNQTLLCGSIFVATNLGVTTRGTRKWYADKFGDEKVKDKWNMIPLVY